MNKENYIKQNDILIKANNTHFGFFLEQNSNEVKIIVKCDTTITDEIINLHISFNPKSQLQHNDAWKLSIEKENVNIKKYTTLDFDKECEIKLQIHQTTDSITVIIPKPNNENEFSFCPTITQNENEFSLISEYITPKYIETWYLLDENNTIYINDIFKNRHIPNWKKDSFKNHETMPVGVIKEQTVEEAIIAMCIAEDKGCCGFDLHLNLLFNNNLLTKENISKICQTSKLPILALNYNPEISQEERLKGLELAIEAGCEAIDFQGFMFCEDKTANTQTPENREHFENLGFDMSFLDAAPQETVVDPEIVKKQREYVEKIHKLGGEVLISTHIQTVLTKKQLKAYAKFHAANGYDILKIVAIGKEATDVVACVEACKELRNDPEFKNVKYTIQLSGERCVYITRLLCPAFYGSYISFCYPELTKWQDPNQLDLDVAVKTIKAKTIDNQDIEIEKGIKILKSLCTHPQFNTIMKDYEDSL